MIILCHFLSLMSWYNNNKNNSSSNGNDNYNSETVTKRVFLKLVG